MVYLRQMPAFATPLYLPSRGEVVSVSLLEEGLGEVAWLSPPELPAVAKNPLAAIRRMCKITKFGTDFS